MKRVLLAFLACLSFSNPANALIAHFSNDTGEVITISVQDNSCVTYDGSQATHELPGQTPVGGWEMFLGDRNTGGCSASYMLAWGIYYGDTVDPSNKIGDINFHYQSGIRVETWQNKTTNTAKFFSNFYICSHSEIRNNSWDDSYVWWHFGKQAYSDWDCKAPTN